MVCVKTYLKMPETNTFAVAQLGPKVMFVRKDGRILKVIGQPKFLFEMEEMFNAGKLCVKKN